MSGPDYGEILKPKSPERLENIDTTQFHLEEYTSYHDMVSAIQEEGAPPDLEAVDEIDYGVVQTGFYSRLTGQLWLYDVDHVHNEKWEWQKNHGDTTEKPPLFEYLEPGHGRVLLAKRLALGEPI